MPGTPVAKSASRYSLNSFTCFGVMSSFASAVRSSGRSAGRGSGERSPFTRSVGGRPTFRCRSEAFSCTICCRIALKLNAARCGAAVSWSCATVGLAIGINPEEHLPVLDGVRVLNRDFRDDARELGLDLVHDLHRLDD